MDLKHAFEPKLKLKNWIRPGKWVELIGFGLETCLSKQVAKPMTLIAMVNIKLILIFHNNNNNNNNNEIWWNYIYLPFQNK